MQVATLRPLALAALLWRTPVSLFLTVPVKATFQLKPDDVASLISPLPLFRDVFYEQNDGRSLYVASDAAPQKLRADVLLTGSAYAPPGQRVTHRWVRLAVGSAEAPAVDKRLQVVGERRRDPSTGQVSAPLPFARLPIRYELAFGGASFPENPVGMGADPSDLRMPSILDPSNPQALAGFGAIPGAWPQRRRALAGWDPAKLAQATPELPAPMDFSYFNAAPPDQQIPFLRGDEWILLEGLHPSALTVRSRLPGFEARVLLQAPPFTDANGTEIELRCDTLWVDADTLRCAVTWRGVLAIAEEALPELERGRILATLAPLGAPAAWPTAERVKPPIPTQAPRIGAETAPLPEGITKPTAPPTPFPIAEPGQIAGSRMSAEEWITRGARPAPAEPPPGLKETLPLQPRASAEAEPPQAPGRPALTEAAGRPREGEAPTPPSPMAVAPPPPAKPIAQILETRDFNLLDVLRGLNQEDAPFPLASPQQADKEPGEKSPQEVPWATLKQAFPAMAAWIEAHGDAPMPTSTLPLPEPEPSSLTSEELAGSPGVPPPARTTENVPILNVTPFAVFTVPWQVRPPKDSLTVIVKGTFAIVPGEPAVAASEQELPAGDTYVDDDPAKSLRYPSDFAIFKPKADILLVGHAYPPKGTEAMSLVRLRFGDKLDRAIAAIGPRRWDGLGAPTAPEPFERIALRYENAFGGAGFDANPTGTGYSARAGDALPSLEQPGGLLRGIADAPAPACFAPVSPAWKARVEKIGTYDDRWRSARWPFFPDDFDWTYFNAAPAAQQISYPRGDEAFDLWSVRPESGVIRGRLPDARVRVFAQATADAGGGFSEVPLQLDTVWFDADTLKLVLVWRGLLEVSDEDATEIASLFVINEPKDAWMTLKEARARFFGALAARNAAEQEPAGEEGAANDNVGEEAPSDVRARIAEALTNARARRRVAGSAATPVASVDLPGGASPEEAPQGAPVEASPAARDEILELLRLGEPLAGFDLTGIDLSGADLKGRDLGGVILKGANLRGARLDGARLTEAILADADCEGASFEGADLTQADLTAANLKGARFPRAVLELAAAAEAHCEGAIFEDVRAPGASFAEAVLTRACFDRADLTGAEMMRSSIEEASFRGAVLDDVKLYGASGARVIMDGASLVDLRADDARLPRGSFRGVKGDGAVWEGADLTESVFEGASLRESSFTRATLDRATFNAADLVDARFRKARLRGARMLKANLMRGAFDGADLSNADLRGANLYQAETWKARVADVTLTGALVAGSKLAK